MPAGLIRADPATFRYLSKGTWAVVCLLSCPWLGRSFLYVIAGRGGFGRVP